jgi:hypothetical protein
MTDTTDAASGLPDGDALTPAEQAYMESGGEKAEALIAENTAEGGSTPSADPSDKPQDASADGKSDPKADTAHAADDAAADLAATDPQRPPPQRVSYHKFKRTEDRAKTAERELADMREKFARGDERLRLLSEALTREPPREDPAPDPEQDIFSFVRWQGRQLDRLAQELHNTRGEIGATRDTISQREAVDALRTAYQRDAVAFAQKTPDFAQAYNHLLNTRAAMLAEQGYGAADVRQILGNEERGLVQRALAANKSPAEMMYATAQRFGYAGTGAARATESTRSGRPSAGELLRNVQAGQAASKTLSASGGAASDLSVEALVNMSEADFNALLRARPHQVEALMGRRR